MIEPSALRVATQIIWYSCQLSYTMHFTKMRNDLVIKRSTLITKDPDRNSKYTEPLLHQTFGNSKGLLVVSHKSLTLLREGISENKDVLLTSLCNISFSEIYTEKFQRLVCYQTTLLCFGLCIVTL